LERKYDPFNDASKWSISILPGNLNIQKVLNDIFHQVDFTGVEKILSAETLDEKFFVGFERDIGIQEPPKGFFSLVKIT